jgi:hypothetical protein
MSSRAGRQADLFWRDLMGRRSGGDRTSLMAAREAYFADGAEAEDVAEEDKVVPRELPKLTKVIGDGTALFELLPWSVEWKDPADENKNMYGFFWMFSDALMWEAPKTGKWAAWGGTKVAHPLPRTPFGGARITDRTRLVRLPCSGQEAQAAVDRLKFSQADLRNSPGGDLAGAPDSSDSKVASLFPTPELYDRTFFQADVRIAAQPGSPSNFKDIDRDTLAYNERVSQAFDKAPPTAPGGTRNSIGTPGKIWAIADRMDTWVCCPEIGGWAFACINYGFHKTIGWVKNKPVVTGIWQPPGGCHPWTHEDYSQIFQLVAGWCWVKGLNETAPSWKKTADVYMDKTLSKLVRNGGPAPALRYHGKATPQPTTPCVKAVKK